MTRKNSKEASIVLLSGFKAELHRYGHPNAEYAEAAMKRSFSFPVQPKTNRHIVVVTVHACEERIGLLMMNFKPEDPVAEATEELETHFDDFIDRAAVVIHNGRAYPRSSSRAKILKTAVKLGISPRIAALLT